MTTDTVFAIFSTTKAITGTAILQCVEEGELDLDAPAKTYLPDIGKFEVIEGFDVAGKPKPRAPKRDIKWEYGSNIDWCGQIVEHIRGKRLGEVMKERIFVPLGGRRFFHQPLRCVRASPSFTSAKPTARCPPLPDLQLPPDPEVHMGGHGLYASIAEYMKFIRMWLNDGTGPHGSVLKKETIEAAVRNGLEAHQAVVMLPGVIATPSNDAEFFPGLKKSWCYTFMINDEDAPTGRPAGALGWAGLANLFYWIDRKNGFRLLGDADSAVRRPDFVRWLPGFRDGRLFESSGARGSISGGRLPTARLLPKRKAEES
jgi:methyl acetate hydrolase